MNDYSYLSSLDCVFCSCNLLLSVILLFVVYDYNLVLYNSYYVFLDIHDEEFPNIEALK